MMMQFKDLDNIWIILWGFLLAWHLLLSDAHLGVAPPHLVVLQPRLTMKRHRSGPGGGVLL
jgi:hypothetical protein